MAENQGTGYLRVQTVSAGGALPVEGALVLVLDEESKNTVSSQRTDRSGLTETLSLPTPARGLSQSPSSVAPYSTYTVQVSKDGYFSAFDYSIPVFDGVTSLQRVNLIPIGEFDTPTVPREELTVETPGYGSLMVRNDNES